MVNSGWGRGRPKKALGKIAAINPASEEYFKTSKLAGGPSDPFTGFEEVIKQLYTDSEQNDSNSKDKADVEMEIENKESEDKLASDPAPPPKEEHKATEAPKEEEDIDPATEP